MSNKEDKPLINTKENQVPESKFSAYKNSFPLLLKSETSYFLTIMINFSTSVQYYILVTLIPLYFTDEHGFSDVEAGVIFGGFGVVIGFSSIYLTHNIHSISFKRGLYVSFTLGCIGFGLILADNVWLSLVSVLVFQAVSCSITWPYIEYGIKMYSQTEIRTLSTSVFYMSQYLAGIVTGVTIDSLWSSISNKQSLYFLISSVGISLLFIAAICLFFCRDVSNIEEERSNSEEVLKTKKFWRYCFLIFILIMLRSSSFGHLDATLPKFMLRMEGDDAHFGMMLAVHSFNMMIGLLFLTSLTYYIESYDLILIGAAIGSLGSIWLIFIQNMLGYVLFVLFISTGESIWVPRVLDYTYSVAPEGGEGIYLALCNCPFYFGMIVTGATSGLLLYEYCPDDDETGSCYKVWIWVFVGSVFITLLLVSLKKVIIGPKGEKAEIMCCFRDKDVKEEELEEDEEAAET
jgi:predicted MFS family arabinose efflux permease